MSPAPGKRREARSLCVLAALCALSAWPVGAAAVEPPPAAGRFLVAARDMTDPNFSATVVLLLRHGQDGAMGLVVNRPMAVLPEQVIPDIEGLGRYAGPLFLGGPVQVNFVTFLVRGTAELDGSTQVLPDVRYSTDPALLAELTSGPTDAASLRVYAGYAGWAPGQLENEIERGGWHVLPGDSAAVFSEEPATVWRELAPLPEPLSASNVGRSAVTRLARSRTAKPRAGWFLPPGTACVRCLPARPVPATALICRYSAVAPSFAIADPRPSGVRGGATPRPTRKNSGLSRAYPGHWPGRKTLRKRSGAG